MGAWTKEDNKNNSNDIEIDNNNEEEFRFDKNYEEIY